MEILKSNLYKIKKWLKLEKCFIIELFNEDMEEIRKLDTTDSLFFNHQDSKMVEWLDNIVKSRRNNRDFRKDKKNW